MTADKKYKFLKNRQIFLLAAFLTLGWIGTALASCDLLQTPGSPDGKTADTIPPGTPSIPELLFVGDGSATITWFSIFEAFTYEIAVIEEPAQGTEVSIDALAPAGDVTLALNEGKVTGTIKGLQNDTMYWCYVRAVKDSGLAGKWSYPCAVSPHVRNVAVLSPQNKELQSFASLSEAYDYIKSPLAPQYDSFTVLIATDGLTSGEQELTIDDKIITITSDRRDLTAQGPTLFTVSAPVLATQQTEVIIKGITLVGNNGTGPLVKLDGGTLTIGTGAVLSGSGDCAIAVTAGQLTVSGIAGYGTGGAKITGNAQGIRVDGGSVVLDEDGEVTDNTGTGIVVTGTTTVQIKGNAKVANSAAGIAAVEIQQGACMIGDNAVIDSQNGCGLLVDTTGTAQSLITGGTLAGGINAVDLKAGKLSMSAGTVTGGGILIEGGEFNMNGGTVQAGGILLKDNPAATFIMGGSALVDTTAANNSIVLPQGKTITLSDTVGWSKAAVIVPEAGKESDFYDTATQVLSGQNLSDNCLRFIIPNEGSNVWRINTSGYLSRFQGVFLITNGDDTNDGYSEATAVRTLGRALTITEDGGTIFVKGMLTGSQNAGSANNSTSEFVVEGRTIIFTTINGATGGFTGSTNKSALAVTNSALVVLNGITTSSSSGTCLNKEVVVQNSTLETVGSVTLGSIWADNSILRISTQTTLPKATVTGNTGKVQVQNGVNAAVSEMFFTMNTSPSILNIDSSSTLTVASIKLKEGGKLTLARGITLTANITIDSPANGAALVLEAQSTVSGDIAISQANGTDPITMRMNAGAVITRTLSVDDSNAAASVQGSIDHISLNGGQVDTIGSLTTSSTSQIISGTFNLYHTWQKANGGRVAYISNPVTFSMSSEANVPSGYVQLYNVPITINTLTGRTMTRAVITTNADAGDIAISGSFSAADTHAFLVQPNDKSLYIGEDGKYKQYSALYVKSSGDDKNNGSTETLAFKTLDKALEYANGPNGNAPMRTITVAGELGTDNSLSAATDAMFVIANTGSNPIIIKGKDTATTDIAAPAAGAATETTATVSAHQLKSDGSKGVVKIAGNSRIRFENITLTGSGGTGGGGLSINNSNAGITLGQGAYICGNATTGNGGGILIASGQLTIETGSTISHNKASNGGGIYVGGGSVTFTNGSIAKNTANPSGGGVYIGSGEFTMDGGEIKANIGTSSGGGVYINSSGTFNFAGGYISGNTTGSVNANPGRSVYINGTFNVSGSAACEMPANGTITNDVFLAHGKQVVITGILSSNNASSTPAKSFMLNFDSTAWQAGETVITTTNTQDYQRIDLAFNLPFTINNTSGHLQ